MHECVNIELAWVISETIKGRPERIVILSLGTEVAHLLLVLSAHLAHVKGRLHLWNLRQVDGLKACHTSAWSTRLATALPVVLVS